ncbi:MAG: (d)CMP kinase, partial [Candidatus Heimdallarchaeota archaeon]|nr:(d)CMP kinase [Candidatus Heimdallarchaeota archaeon]
MLKNDPYIIGISGPTGSGKTFITKQLAEKFRNHNFSVEIISTDDFYRDLSHLTFDERTKVNYDDPDSIDFGEFNDVLKRINQGEKVTINQYDFKTHTRINKQRTFNVANIIIVEG